MTPPISIDGTDITGATIDGQDVQEITVDGQTVFSAVPDIPDSVIAQFDARVSDTVIESNGKVVEWTDRSVNGYNLTGEASSYDSSAINGHPAILFDGDFLSNVDFQFNGDFTSFAVVELQSGTGQQMGIFTGTVGNNGNVQPLYYHDGSPKQWRVRNLGESQQVEGTTDTSRQLLTSVVSDNAALREDGSETATANWSDPNIFDELHVGVRDSDSKYWNGYIGFLEIHDEELSLSQISNRESNIASEWGISI